MKKNWKKVVRGPSQGRSKISTFWSKNSHFSRSLSSWQGLRKYFKVFFSFFCNWDPVGLFLVNYIYFGFVSVRVAEIDAGGAWGAPLTQGHPDRGQEPKKKKNFFLGVM